MAHSKNINNRFKYSTDQNKNTNFCALSHKDVNYKQTKNIYLLSVITKYNIFYNNNEIIY